MTSSCYASRRWGEALPRTLALGIALSSLLSCAPIRGYPENPGDNDQTIDSLLAAATDTRIKYYQAASNPAATPAELKALRNRTVLGEMQVYEIYFTRFQARLWGDTNIVSVGGDLSILILNGLAATTGGAATKSALAAASAGIVGAQGAINRDIYYQRTLPAILAQMSANRDIIKAGILDALNTRDDSSYPLAAAEMDLQVLQRASGIADAVQNITLSATAQKAAAQALVDTYRTADFSTAASAQRIRAWIGFGQPSFNQINLAALQNWVTANLPGLPVEKLLEDKPGSQVMEQVRQRAIADLHIPP